EPPGQRDYGRADRGLVGAGVLVAPYALQEAALRVGNREIVGDDVVGRERRHFSLDHGHGGVQAVGAARDADAIDAAEDDLVAILLVGEERDRRGARRIGVRVVVVLVVVGVARPYEAGEILHEQLEALGSHAPYPRRIVVRRAVPVDVGQHPAPYQAPEVVVVLAAPASGEVGGGADLGRGLRVAQEEELEGAL